MPRKHAPRILESACKGCGICARFCTGDVLEMSEGYNAKGYHQPRRKKGSECNGCRNCELMCPDLAIYVEEEGR